MEGAKVSSLKQAAVLIAFLTLGCADNPPAKVTNPSSGATCNTETTNGCTGLDTPSANSDICSALMAYQRVGLRYGSLLTRLCANGASQLSLLRSPQYRYMGNEPANLIIDAQESTQQKADNLARSNMVASGLFATPASPCSYFHLMQMKVDTPKKFELQFPEEMYKSRNEVKYEKISGNVQSGIHYRYTASETDTADAGTIDYEAIASFYTLVPKQLYVVATDFQKKYDMIDNIRGLSIISRDASGVTEIVNISEQLFENGNNHDSAVSDARKDLTQDMRNSYKQALYKHNNIDKGQCPLN